MHNSFLKYISFFYVVGFGLSNIIAAAEPVLLESPSYMPKYHQDYQDVSDVKVPRLFKIGTLDRYSPEHTFDEIEIDRTNSTTTHESLEQLKVTPFKLDLLQKEYDPKDFKELVPYASTFYGLNVSETSLENLDLLNLQPFVHLRYLDVSENRFDDDGLITISYLRELIELRITYNKITQNGAKHLKMLEKLQILDASCTYLGNSGIQALSDCKSVVCLNVEACGFDDSALGYFHAMPALKSLNISSNKGLTLPGIQKFLLEKKDDLIVTYNQ